MNGKDIPAKYEIPYAKLTVALDSARRRLEQCQEQLEGSPNNLKFRQQLANTEIKVKDAESKLALLELKIATEVESIKKELARQEAAAAAAILAWEELLGVGGLEEMIKKNGEPIHYTQRSLSLNDVFWGESLLRKRTILYSPAHKEFFEYDANTGLWSPVSHAKLTSQLHHLLIHMDREVYEGSIARCSKEEARNRIIESQRGIRENKKAFVETAHTSTQVKNGVLVFDNYKVALKPFAPEFYNRYASELPYDPNADCPKFKALIAHLTEDDQDALQRAAGQVLVGQNLCQRIFILEGAANSGKSTFVEVLRKVVGSAATILRTSHLDRPFEMFKMYDKSLLIGVDVPHDFLLQDAAQLLKSLTGGDQCLAEKKNSNEPFYFSGNLNIMITSNSQLVIKLFSDAGAWERRLVIFDFPPIDRPIEKNIDNYAQRLYAEEGVGIQNWMAQGANKLMKNLEEGKGFILTDEQKKRVTERIAESDSLSLFLQQRVIKSLLPDACIATEDIMRIYAAFCLQNEWGHPSVKVVERRLSELLPHMYQATRYNKIVGQRGRFLRGYKGISWNVFNSAEDSGPYDAEQAANIRKRTEEMASLQRAFDKSRERTNYRN